MAETITYSVSVQVVSGPKISASSSVSVEAYDKTSVTIAAGDTDTEVNIQPGGAGLASLVVITASEYDATLTYKVNSDTGTEIELDGPHVLVGAGAVALLDPAPASLFFSNGLTEDVTVSVLVGRDATP